MFHQIHRIPAGALLLMCCAICCAAAQEAPAPPVRNDLYGDPLPDDATGRLGTIRLRHDANVLCVAASSDASLLASGGQDNTVRVWNAESGKQIAKLTGHTGAIACVAISPDKKTLASASADKTVRVFDIESGRTLRTFDGKHGELSSVAFSIDGKTLAASGADHFVRLYNLGTGEQLASIPGSFGQIRSAQFSPDGKFLAWSGSDAAAHLWDLTKEKEIRDFGGHRGPVLAVAFSPDGNMLASADIQSIFVWDPYTGRKIASKPNNGSLGPLSIAFSRDGATLGSAIGYPGIRLWNTKNFESIKGLTLGPAASLVFLPDGKTLAVASGLDQFIHLWDLASGEEIVRQETHRAPVTCVAFAPDGKTAVSTSQDGSLRRWEVATGEALQEIKMKEAMTCAAFSNDGKMLAYAAGPVVHLRDVQNGKELEPLKVDVPSNSIQFSRDGKTLLSCDRYDVRIRDIRGSERRRFQGSGQELNGSMAVFCGDGRTVAIAREAQVQLFDLTTDKLIRALPAPGPGRVAVSNGGILAFVGSENEHDGKAGLGLWDPATGKRLQHLEGNSGQVFALAFSRDGRRVAAGGQDAIVRLWDADTGKLIKEWKGHGAQVNCVAFSPDGRTVGSASSDATVLFWDATGCCNENQAPPTDADWDALTSDDAGKANRAFWKLANNSAAAVPLLMRGLNPEVLPERHKEIAGLIAQLDSEDFEVRERATETLKNSDAWALGFLKTELDSKPSEEVRTRINSIVKSWTTGASHLRLRRSIAILECIGTPGAQEVLRSIAEWSLESPAKLEAKAALERILNAESVGR